MAAAAPLRLNLPARTLLSAVDAQVGVSEVFVLTGGAWRHERCGGGRGGGGISVIAGAVLVLVAADWCGEEAAVSFLIDAFDLRRLTLEDSLRILGKTKITFFFLF